MAGTTPNPEVSVIVTSYNQRRYLTQALQSVMDQTLENCEAVVVDDASTDRSDEVISDYLFGIRAGR